ncbi:glycosyltransferase family 2 protein [Methanobrevibacter millerae]|uniref:Glycosyl transferase GT2 family n=1 Tax=Methanobrevibacter millerae TaxID=230361 RepID=A0A0U3EL85_9EURY|nr:glycosyltransferase family 2 protein [Methanobrevibacter millerae]ALT69293.1 glycosyl transferase GT2 family [Methanobrevibacter millerae]
MNYKVSIIIPCYNAEDTIQRAINSIINQNMGFNNIELLLYDDASTDNTKKILKKYSEKYKNIISFFGTENKGPGFGKNKCLENASGEYVLFLDSDDEYDQEMCEKLYSNAIIENADLVSCGVLRIDNINTSKIDLEYDDSKSHENFENKISFINENIFYLNDHLSTHCLFRKDIINQNKIYFLETYYAEDIYFKAIFRLYSKKAVYLKNFYGYIHHAYTDSITSNITLSNLNEIHNVYLKILEKIKKYDLDLAYIFKGHIICSLIRLYALNLVKSPKKDVINFLKKMREFEIYVNFNHVNTPSINILNIFILKEKYELAYLYLHLLRIIYHSKTLRKIYRKIF